MGKKPVGVVKKSAGKNRGGKDLDGGGEKGFGGD